MAKGRGLSEMELNLRTILLQKMAGKSRDVVSSVVQTTKLVVGFFLQNGHKSLEEIIEEIEPTPVPTMSPRSRRKRASPNTFAPHEKKDYEQLRMFIFKKVLANDQLDPSLRTQSCIDVLMEVNLKMADLYNSYCGISNDANRSLVFTEILTKKVEGMYKRAGPRGLPLKTFILFVIEFLQAIGENAAIAPRVTTLD